jgi:PadR family transcriptional regulator, regulatory protein PadR
MPVTRGLSRQTRLVLDAFISHPIGYQTHGFEIARLAMLRTGTVYPILARLEKMGWLTSKWEPLVGVGRPPRRLYQMTAAGRAATNALLVP